MEVKGDEVKKDCLKGNPRVETHELKQPREAPLFPLHWFHSEDTNFSPFTQLHRLEAAKQVTGKRSSFLR